MKIVVLMGGTGSRFANVGYEKPKSFILVDGKTMVNHVVSMYPGNHEFVFVCNENFPKDAMHSLREDFPRSEIVTVPSHKQGPVYTLSLMWDRLHDDEPVLISYCDFNADWDFEGLIERVDQGNWHGAIPCYTGFHPHLLHKNKYAGVIADENGKIRAIREKHSFTDNPEDSFHSAGNYYFTKVSEMKEYAKKLLRSGETVNGEYYVSMIYYYYLEEGKNIFVHPMNHFLQWGTPEDLEEYEAWSLKINGGNKGKTDIPPHRKDAVKIPYTPVSPEYEMSFTYWKKYFSI